ncbi:nucleoside permease [Adhaeribacter pallidiroseus]|uniref:Xanthosine permease n=1 Tax=Adhaeribacter pallidiroseus TaxID=2072847 RepID=A0A369QT18_9BACT|nr:nucleoside permease [Adhaeribacter pallidiroseus]RDC65308.1 Xanthosine permease [Adhaeribacter pallidiroseus]
MTGWVRGQLSAMMFLQFFIWGAWYVTMGTYLANALQADGVAIGDAYSAMSIATIISPFFVGMIADRFFAAQRLLGILHLLGAAVLYYLTTIQDPDIFYWFILLYSLMYAPTLALANAISFNQMREPGKQFAAVRVWGTVGWIATGWLIDQVFHVTPSDLGITFKMAAIASVALAVLSLFLPNTPPKAKDATVRTSEIIGAEAFVLLKNRPFLVFFLASILICIPLSFYYSQTNQFLVESGMEHATRNMTFGQISEALFILAIPFFFRRFGVKYMILIGMLTWVIRFLLFGFGGPDQMWMLFGGIILHGVCFDFFFVTGQIYTDHKAGEKIKSSAQGMITMATYGIGMWIGTKLSGYVAKNYTISPTEHYWQEIWLVPAAIAAVVFVLFAVFFREKQLDRKQVAAAVH